MISLIPTRLHWVKDEGEDDLNDLCAHSPIWFDIDGELLISPEDGNFTVSAAAIYLLRTLEQDHTSENPVGEHLFPCCGHAIYDTGEDDVVICGCSNGSDFSILHVGDTIQISTIDGQFYTVSIDQWRCAIMKFSDTVRQFYDSSLPKKPIQDDVAGFAKMMDEWNRRTQSD